MIMEKTYNNLMDLEKDIIREYNSWKKSDCPYQTKFEMMLVWRDRAKAAKIDHLL